MSKSKRLHPIAAVYNFIKQLKELIIPFLVFGIFGGKGDVGELFYLLVTIGVVLFILIGGIISWLRFSYRIEEGELRIQYGLFIRKKRFIPFDRIQSIGFSEGILHRPLGLVKVKVETAGSGGMGLHDGEAVLTAISKEDAEAIKEMLAAVKNTVRFGEGEEENVVNEEIIYKISPLELLLLASTSSGAGVVISAVFAFLTQVEEIIPYQRVFSEFENLFRSGIIFVSVIAFLGFLLAWLIALVGMMVRYSDFTVKKSDHDIIISRGLLEKRQITIPLDRIQAVKIVENLVRQPIGYAAVIIESAGGSSAKDESASVILLPIIKKKKIAGLLEPFLSGYEVESNFRPAPKKALIRYLIRGWLVIAPFVILPIVFFRPWGYASILLFLIVSCWSFLKYKDAGWSIKQDQLSLRYRSLIKNTIYMKKNKVQSISLNEGYFQRKKELATISATVKSGGGASGGTVADLEREECYKIYQWYSVQ